MAQQLRALLLGDPSLVLSTQIRWLTAIYNFNSKGSNASGLQGHLQFYAHTHIQTYTQISLLTFYCDFHRHPNPIHLPVPSYLPSTLSTFPPKENNKNILM